MQNMEYKILSPTKCESPGSSSNKKKQQPETPNADKSNPRLQSSEYKDSMPSPIINLDIQQDLNVTQDTNPLSQGTKDGERAVKTIIKKLPGRSP